MTHFLGEIRPMASKTPPPGWMKCDGQSLLTTKYGSLFSIIGTIYGGDGSTEFKLPDLRGRVPIHFSDEPSPVPLLLGAEGGVEQVKLNEKTIAKHNHQFMASTIQATRNKPDQAVVASSPPGNKIYAFINDEDFAMRMQGLAAVGGSQPHENRQPYLTLNYCIAYQGIYPQRSSVEEKEGNLEEVEVSETMGPYVGQISLFTGGFAPRISDPQYDIGYLTCDGGMLPTEDYSKLFSLIGYTYGGAGPNFKLPDLRGRIPVHQGSGPGLSNYTLGSASGLEAVNLSLNQIPSHAHLFQGTLDPADTSTPDNTRVLGKEGSEETPLYGEGQKQTTQFLDMNDASVSNSGGSQPHNNMMPFLGLNFIIATDVSYPYVPPQGNEEKSLIIEKAANPAGGFVGEIRIFAGNFAPMNWAFCDGRILQISQYTRLFSIIGTNFGGDGIVTLGLPDMQRRAPIGVGSGPNLTRRKLSERGGTVAEVLSEWELPTHTHALQGISDVADQSAPEWAYLATGKSGKGGTRHNFYGDAVNLTPLSPLAITPIGSGDAHENSQPYLTCNYIICLDGDYPTRDPRL